MTQDAAAFILAVATLAVLVATVGILHWLATVVIDPATEKSMNAVIAARRETLVTDRVADSKESIPGWASRPGDDRFRDCAQELESLGLPRKTAVEVGEQLQEVRTYAVQRLAEAIDRQPFQSAYSIEQVDNLLTRAWRSVRNDARWRSAREAGPVAVGAILKAVADKSTVGVGAGILVAAPIALASWLAASISGTASAASLVDVLNAGLLLGTITAAGWESASITARLSDTRSGLPSAGSSKRILQLIAFYAAAVAVTILVTRAVDPPAVLQQPVAAISVRAAAVVFIGVQIFRLARQLRRETQYRASTRVAVFLAGSGVGLLIAWSILPGYLLASTPHEAAIAIRVWFALAFLAFLASFIQDASERGRGMRRQADRLGLPRPPLSPLAVLVVTLFIAIALTALSALTNSFIADLIAAVFLMPVMLAPFIAAIQWLRQQRWKRETAAAIQRNIAAAREDRESAE